MNQPTFRGNGAFGALLDEYEKSIEALKAVIANISSADLKKILDPETDDEDCKSIQNILSHVVQAGYTYVIEIRKWLGESHAYKNKVKLDSSNDYCIALDTMFAFNEALFNDYPTLQLEEYTPSKKFMVRWGQYYDPEQILEHAIVHILRHRRQIEKFKLLLN